MQNPGAGVTSATRSPRRLWLWPAVALAAYGVMLVLPRPEGLGRLGQAVAGVALAGVILWMS